MLVFDGGMARQEGWEDIKPIAQNEAPHAMAMINYDPECKWNNSVMVQELTHEQTDMLWTPFDTSSRCKSSLKERLI